MSNQSDLLARTIGARVKHERKARGWTLDQLATAADMSRRMVVNVEQGTTNPSIGILLRLSDALGIGLPALVEPPQPHREKLTRSGEGAVLWTGEHGGVGTLVAGTERPDIVELWDWILEAGESHTSEAHAAGTRELLQVQEGAMSVEVGGVIHHLGPRDALTFDGDLPHAYANTHAAPARFTLAVFEPGVGAA